MSETNSPETHNSAKYNSAKHDSAKHSSAMWNLKNAVEESADPQRLSATSLAGSARIELSPVEPQEFVKFGVGGSTESSEDACGWHAVSVVPIPSHSMQPDEVYTRGTDLIARFPQGEQDQYTFQLDWRVLPSIAKQLIGVELWVSIQTNFLDTHPKLEIKSQGSDRNWVSYSPEQLRGQSELHASDLHASEATGEAEPEAINRIAAMVTQFPTHAGVWLIDPSDQGQVKQITELDESEQRIELFGQFLEKGVIRRGRMRFVLVEGVPSRELLQEMYHDLATSPLPLTA